MKRYKSTLFAFVAAYLLCPAGTRWAEGECEAAPPTGSTYPAMQISSDDAVLKGGLVDDGGLPSSFRFHYWALGGPEMTTDWTSFSSYLHSIAFKRIVATPDTLYTYFIEVRNDAGSTTDTGNRSFTTLARLTTASGEGGSVSLPGEGTFIESGGTTLVLEAVAEEGYVFTGWSGSALANTEDPLAAVTQVTVGGGLGLQANFAKAVPFSLNAYGDIELSNDEERGPDMAGNFSGMGAQDTETRRRVSLISYDISALKGRGRVYNVGFSHFSHDAHDATNIYGVLEEADLLEVEALTWNSAPGVMNDPTPELGAPVALDMADLTEPLLTFEGPGKTGIRFYTENSEALADFINSDTDGVVTFLLAARDEGGQLILRTRSHSAGGSFLMGETASRGDITWVTETVDRDMDGLQDDQGFIDLLTDNGYRLDVRPDYWTALEGQDADDTTDYVGELNAADLVIISRSVNSGSYDDDGEPTLWNSVTSPMLQLGAYLSRSSRWLWMNSAEVSNQEAPFMIAVNAEHPLLAGVEIDADGLIVPLDGTVGSGQNTFLATADAGNGSVIATTLGGEVWVAEWATGSEFYEGAGQIAGGPRMVFFSGTQEVDVTPQGALNLTPAGTQILLNAVSYMISQ